eukprot:611398-Pleurochrysis_carterae.AAC.1
MLTIDAWLQLIARRQTPRAPPLATHPSWPPIVAVVLDQKLGMLKLMRKKQHQYACYLRYDSPKLAGCSSCWKGLGTFDSCMASVSCYTATSALL